VVELMFKTRESDLSVQMHFSKSHEKQQRVLIASKRSHKRTKTSGTPVPLPVNNQINCVRENTNEAVLVQMSRQHDGLYSWSPHGILRSPPLRVLMSDSRFMGRASMGKCDRERFESRG
jgi:hypothetical protein